VIIVDNLALYKPCQQSTTYGGLLAAKAVNGKLDDFTHTESEPAGKWWMVDLKEKFHVSSIRIYNRLENNCNFCMYNYKRDSIFYIYSAIFNEAKYLVYFIKLTSFFCRKSDFSN